MKMNGNFLAAGDLFSFAPGEVAQPEFLQDCEVIVVKVPSLPRDKMLA